MGKERERTGRAHLGEAHDDGRSGARHSGDGDEARLRRRIGEAKQRWARTAQGIAGVRGEKTGQRVRKNCAAGEEIVRN
jgi:hypothetical protein